MLKVAKIAPCLPDWSRKFDNPIPIVNGKLLFRLRDAGQFIEALPKAEQDAPRWRTATELLIFAAKGAPTMLARIAVMRALHHREPQTEFPARRRRAKTIRIIR
jgi:hypothetical protein